MAQNEHCPFCGSEALDAEGYGRKYLQCGNRGCWLYGMLCNPNRWNTRAIPRKVNVAGLPRKEKLLEKIARAICTSNGFFPDDLQRSHFLNPNNGFPRWMDYQRSAEYVVEELVKNGVIVTLEKQP